MEGLRNSVLDQLARTTLLPTSLLSSILAGNPATTEEIVMALLHHSIDCEVVMANDPDATWPEKRIARAVLSATFANALLYSNTLRR
jgi:hypothetical protein